MTFSPQWIYLLDYAHACFFVDAVIISIPPMIGHTTMLHVCGFAYGLKGFPLAAAASVIGSSAVFLALRFLFGKKLRAWSSSNDKWQALETVIVCLEPPSSRCLP